jgi:cold shock CspA family protein
MDFVHISAVEQPGMRGLAEGQKVSYEVEADRHSGKGLRPTSRAHKRLRYEAPRP